LIQLLSRVAAQVALITEVNAFIEPLLLVAPEGLAASLIG